MSSYEILVKPEGFDDEKSPVSGGSGSSKTYGEKSQQSMEKAVKGLVSYNAIKGTADSLMAQAINRVEIRTGSIEYEQQLQFGYEMASRAADSLYSVGVGLVLGGAPGAIVGAVYSIGQTFVGYWQNQQTINLKKDEERASQNLMNRRAGTYENRR